MKNFSISLRQFTVLSLLGLAVWLQSPLIACAVVAALVIKEGREFLEQKQRIVELEEFEKRLNAQADELRQVRGEMNRIVVRHAQTFGD